MAGIRRIRVTERCVRGGRVVSSDFYFIPLHSSLYQFCISAPSTRNLRSLYPTTSALEFDTPSSAKNTLKHLIIETLHIPLTYLSSDAEALQVIYDPSVLTYATLIEFFYKMHDPTTKNRQGGDAGTQYRSAIYWHDAEQEKVANEITAKVGKQWWRASPVTTEVAPAGEWFDAEGYHQKYLDKTPGGYECPSQ